MRGYAPPQPKPELRRGLNDVSNEFTGTMWVCSFEMALGVGLNMEYLLLW